MAATEAQVAEILTDPDTHAAVARRLGVNRQTVLDIRRGRTHKAVRPDLPRWGATGQRTCRRCIHWDEDRCGFAFPEPMGIDGPGLAFALECICFRAA